MALKTLKDLKQGETRTIQLTFKDSSAVAINITGYSFWMTLKKDPDTADDATGNLLITGSIISAAGGTAKYTISSAQSAALATGKYYVGFRYKTNGGEIIDFEDYLDNNSIIQIKPSRVQKTS
jgi:hypothetical protein